jgi:putative heme degradation protein
MSASAARITRPYDASTMAARCGDDVVRLRPMWPSIIAATRFARNVRWVFGNRAGTLECVEPQQRRWLTQRGADDPVQIQFNLLQWNSAYARCEGRAREIDVFAADGSAIAAVRLDNVDASLDELLWLLVDDNQQCAVTTSARTVRIENTFDQERLRDALAVTERRSDFDRLVKRSGVTRRHAFRLAGTGVARPLVAGAVQSALLAAGEAELPLRLVLENAGGRVAWSPGEPVVSQTGDVVELRSALGRMTLGDRAATWAVSLAGTDSSEQTLEVYGGDDASWLSIGLYRATPLQRIAWRGMCAMLAGA